MQNFDPLVCKGEVNSIHERDENGLQITQNVCSTSLAAETVEATRRSKAQANKKTGRPILIEGLAEAKMREEKERERERKYGILLKE